MRKFQIWATFPDGIRVKVESHKSMKAAQAAVDAMNHKIQNDLAIGYGFPHGVPTYSIK